MAKHDCFEGGRVYYKDFDILPLLETTHWEFSYYTCKDCQLRYLRAFMEDEGYPRSGHWVMAEIDADFERENPDELELLTFLSVQKRLFYGGSHWDTTGEWADYHPNRPVFHKLRRYLEFRNTK